MTRALAYIGLELLARFCFRFFSDACMQTQGIYSLATAWNLTDLGIQYGREPCCGDWPDTDPNQSLVGPPTDMRVNGAQPATAVKIHQY